MGALNCTSNTLPKCESLVKSILQNKIGNDISLLYLKIFTRRILFFIVNEAPYILSLPWPVEHNQYLQNTDDTSFES